MKCCGVQIYIVLMLSFSVLLLSCSDEEKKFGNLRISFIDLLTDSEGNANIMQTDDGKEYNIINPPDHLRPDTTYRYVAYYEPTDGGVFLASNAPALSGSPTTTSPSNKVTDPVRMQSIWRSGKYINMVLNIKGKNVHHTIGFIDKGVITSPSGTGYLNLELYHCANNDMEAYFHNVYASCLLTSYNGRLLPGRDSILFTVKQYNKGKTIFRLSF